MPPRFSHSCALPGFPAQNEEGRTPGHSLQVTIPPFRLTAVLSGLVLVAISLVQSPDQQEPEALAPLILRGHTDQVNAIAFAPDGRTLASGSEDHTAVLWDVSTSKRKPLMLEHVAAVVKQTGNRVDQLPSLPVINRDAHPTELDFKLPGEPQTLAGTMGLPTGENLPPGAAGERVVER